MHFTCLIPPAHVNVICNESVLIKTYGSVDGVMHGSIVTGNNEEKIISIHFQHMSHEEMSHGLKLTILGIKNLYNSGKWDGRAITCSFDDKPKIVSASTLLFADIKTTRISVQDVLC
jgi:hypothetical protein